MCRGKHAHVANPLKFFSTLYLTVSLSLRGGGLEGWKEGPEKSHVMCVDGRACVADDFGTHPYSGVGYRCPQRLLVGLAPSGTAISFSCTRAGCIGRRRFNYSQTQSSAEARLIYSTATSGFSCSWRANHAHPKALGLGTYCPSGQGGPVSAQTYCRVPWGARAWTVDMKAPQITLIEQHQQPYQQVGAATHINWRKEGNRGK